MSLYYYRIFGEEFGPVSLELLQREIACGQLSGAHEVRCRDETSWTRVADFIAQGLTNHGPTTWSAHSILAWDGGHDDMETVETVCDDPATKTVHQWYCRGSRVGRGPFTFDDLRSLAHRGELDADDELSLRDHGPWTTVGSVGRLMAEMSCPPAERTSPFSSAAIAVAEVDFETSVPNSAEKLVAVETKTLWYARMGQVERGPMEF